MIVDENENARLQAGDGVQVENESTGKRNLDGEVAQEVLLQEMSGIIENDGCRLGMRAGREDLRGLGRLQRDGLQVLL